MTYWLNNCAPSSAILLRKGTRASADARVLADKSAGKQCLASSNRFHALHAGHPFLQHRLHSGFQGKIGKRASAARAEEAHLDDPGFRAYKFNVARVPREHRADILERFSDRLAHAQKIIPHRNLKQKVAELADQEERDEPPDEGEREHDAPFFSEVRLFQHHHPEDETRKNRIQDGNDDRRNEEPLFLDGGAFHAYYNYSPNYFRNPGSRKRSATASATAQSIFLTKTSIYAFRAVAKTKKEACSYTSRKRRPTAYQTRPW